MGGVVELRLRYGGRPSEAVRGRRRPESMPCSDHCEQGAQRAARESALQKGGKDGRKMAVAVEMGG
jgi:hypothetical protein